MIFRRRSVLVVVAAGTALALGGWLATRARTATGQTAVTVNLAAPQQVIQGWGSTERIWTDQHLTQGPGPVIPPAVQADILTKLIRTLDITRFRAMLDPGIELSKGGPFNFGGKLTDGNVAFIKQAKRFGLQTFFPAPNYLEDWMKPDDPSGYVDYAMAILKRWRQLGLEPPLWSVVNEPQVTHDFPPQWMHDVVLQLGRRLRAAGFKTKLVIPDDENPVDAYRRAAAVLQDPAARQYVAAVAFHIYRQTTPDSLQQLRALATRYKLPLWMTEFSSADYGSWPGVLAWAEKMHELITVGGVNAIDYLYVFFGNSPDAPISLQFSNSQYQGYVIKPAYWVIGQFSRFVRPGYRVVRVSTSSDGGVLVSAYKGSGKTVVVAINSQGSAQPLRVSLAGGSLKGKLLSVRSSSTENWKTTAVGHTANGFSATLPAESVTTFVSTVGR